MIIRINQLLKIFYFCSIHNWKTFLYVEDLNEKKIRSFCSFEKWYWSIEHRSNKSCCTYEIELLFASKALFSFLLEKNESSGREKFAVLFILLYRSRKFDSKEDIKGHFEKSKSNCINGSYIYRTWWQGMNLCYCFPSFFTYQWM